MVFLLLRSPDNISCGEHKIVAMEILLLEPLICLARGNLNFVISSCSHFVKLPNCSVEPKPDFNLITSLIPDITSGIFRLSGWGWNLFYQVLTSYQVICLISAYFAWYTGIFRTHCRSEIRVFWLLSGNSPDTWYHDNTATWYQVSALIWNTP